jgi:hypothetical protein
MANKWYIPSEETHLDDLLSSISHMLKAIHAQESRAASRVPRSEEQIPSTLQASLAERLDHIGVSKFLAQVGSIFGREFDVNALLEISGWPNTEFERGIANLVTSGLIRRHQISDRFSFKHSLNEGCRL